LLQITPVHAAFTFKLNYSGLVFGPRGGWVMFLKNNNTHTSSELLKHKVKLVLLFKKLH